MKEGGRDFVALVAQIATFDQDGSGFSATRWRHHLRRSIEGVAYTRNRACDRLDRCHVARRNCNGNDRSDRWGRAPDGLRIVRTPKAGALAAVCKVARRRPHFPARGRHHRNVGFNELGSVGKDRCYGGDQNLPQLFLGARRTRDASATAPRNVDDRLVGPWCSRAMVFNGLAVSTLFAFRKNRRRHSAGSSRSCSNLPTMSCRCRA